ncbi:MAG: HK97-gp10 family putative phage morphogenesis protein [Pseudomonadota bacterium]
MGEGLASFQKRLKAIPQAARDCLAVPLAQAAQIVADTQAALAPQDTGALMASITVTPPGGSTPAYSQPGGSHVVDMLSAAVTVGNTKVRYGHLVEYGTKNAEAQPFFWPGFRLSRKRAASKIKRAISKAIKGVK